MLLNQSVSLFVCGSHLNKILENNVYVQTVNKQNRVRIPPLVHCFMMLLFQILMNAAVTHV